LPRKSGKREKNCPKRRKGSCKGEDALQKRKRKGKDSAREARKREGMGAFLNCNRREKVSGSLTLFLMTLRVSISEIMSE
jgi:hypothetical protein